MKRTIYRYAGMALQLLLAGGVLGACSDEDGVGGGYGDDSGAVALDLTLDPTPLSASGSTLSRSIISEITTEHLSLTLTDVDRNKVTNHTVSDFNEPMTVSTGNYKLEAAYGTPEAEGWGCLYCYGSQEFRVKLNNTTEIELPVMMGNSIVEISYSEAFSSYLSNVSTSVITAGGHSFEWDGDNAEDLYISPGEFSVMVSFTKPNGKDGSIKVGPYTAEPKHQYEVSLDVDYESVESLVVNIDDSINEVEDEIDISDESLIKLQPAPEVLISDGFTIGQEIEMVEFEPVNASLSFTVEARGRIARAILAIESPELKDQDFPEEIDLCNPGAKAEKLREYGIVHRGFTGVKDVYAIIDFTGFLPNIPCIGKFDTHKSTFRLTVVDEQGREEEVTLFSTDITPLVLNVPEHGQVTSTGNASINVECNSSDPDFEAFVRGESGSWYPLTVSASATGESSVNGKVYTLELAGDKLTFEREIPIKISVADKRREIEDKLLVPATMIVGSKTNAFAKSAYLTVQMTSAEAAATADDVTFELVGTDGVSSTQATAELVTAPSKAEAGQRAVYRLTGLQPSTNYSVRSVLNGDKSVSSTFTTETDKVFDFGTFDQWTSEKKNNYQYLWIPGSTWATVNNLTLSQPGNPTYAYKGTSGTIPANGRSNYSNRYGGFIGTDQKADGHTQGVDNLHSDLSHTGANAALIRTVGYGSGNTAGAGTGNPASGFATCQHVAAGELYLGTYDNGPVYSGSDFESRPVSVTFYYKYVSYGSSGDYGDCEVIVYDASGEKITGSGVTEIRAQADYAPMTLTLDYPADAKKAAKIMIRFKSSANPGLTNNSTWLYGPGNKNLSGGEYVGSELYIDDVTFNY